MTRHELASFALKLLGIYVLFESLPFLQQVGSLVYMLPGYRNQPISVFWVTLITLVPLLLVVAAGAVLIVFSRSLAPVLIGEDKPLGISSAVTGRDVQAIGFSIVAVLIFLQAVPPIGQATWTIYYAASHRFPESAASQVVQGVWRYGVPAAIQLVLAVILFLRARGLAKLWHRIRVGGQAGAEEPDAGRVPPDQHRR
jgi:hypothetical protein